MTKNEGDDSEKSEIEKIAFSIYSASTGAIKNIHLPVTDIKKLPANINSEFFLPKQAFNQSWFHEYP